MFKLITVLTITVAMACGCTPSNSSVSGVVLDGKAHPIAGAKVEAVKGDTVLRTKTGKDGAFKFKSLEPQTYYAIAVYPDNSERVIRSRTTTNLPGKITKLSPIVSRFIFSKDSDAVFDTKLNIFWALDAGNSSKMSITEASEWVKTNPQGWRLPTKDELSSLSECFTGMNTLDRILMDIGFRNIQPELYWTSTEVRDEWTWGASIALEASPMALSNQARILIWPVRDNAK